MTRNNEISKRKRRMKKKTAQGLALCDKKLFRTWKLLGHATEWLELETRANPYQGLLV